jgi:hypothetical protein
MKNLMYEKIEKTKEYLNYIVVKNFINRKDMI